MKIIIYDLETTGFSPKKNKIVELYFYNIQENTQLHLLVNPKCLIDPETTKIHGLTNIDLDNKPEFKEIIPSILDFCGIDAYLISHNNIGFDKPFLLSEMKRSGIRRPKNWKFIDTLRLARTIYPELNNHKQDTLRKKFNLSCKGNHRANKDVKDLFIIYNNMTQGMTIEEIYKMSKKFIYTTMPFGKHKGIPLKDIPKDYIQWLVEKILPKDKLLLKSFIKAGILSKN